MESMFFFFEPLKYERFVDQFGQTILDPNELRTAYLAWTSEFCRKSLLFYQNQYRAHSDITWMEFCRTYEIPDYEHPSNFSLELEWEDWKEVHLLSSHYSRSEEKIESMSRLEEKIGEEFKPNALLNRELIPPKEIDKIWFNDLVNNSPQVVAELRGLKYPRYLETEHWRRIRAAMFLINKAICQAADCYVVGESWYGGSESGLDVHHLTYANRGNERFEDLALLCRQHHEYLHSNNNEVPPNSEENEKIFLEDIFEDDKGQ
jgi:5-methylcytosine-specific restriction endonuclease McrA